MEDKTIIDLWREGFTVQQVSKEYMNSFNKKTKNKEKKLTLFQAQKHVEPIIFKYQTSLTKS